jgi:cysteine desulfurase
MHVNNEIGSIQPLQSIIKGIRERNRKTRIHVDGVQSLGKINIDVKSLDIDLMSLSAHKIHGPKGLGAMYIKRGLKLKALISGGGQEMDIRSGTENVPGISGFGLACEIIYSKMSEGSKNVKRLKAHFIKRLGELEGVLINSPNDDEHIDNILNVSFSGVRGEVLLHALEEHSIYVSTGSACSARREEHKNYVLPAIGLKACQIEGTIRFSFSYENTLDEVDYTVEVLNSSLKFLRRIKR